MSSKIYTKYLSETDYDEWNTSISKSQGGSIYSTSKYLDILCKATGAKYKILAALRGDEIVGGIGLYEQQESHFGTSIFPRLLLYYNGIVLKDFDIKNSSKRTSLNLKITSVLEKVLSKAGYKGFELKSRSSFKEVRVFLARGWDADLSYTYVVDCSDMNKLWDRIDQNLRRLIKRCAERNFHFSDDDDFDSLYRLHMQTHNRKGIQLYLPYKQFKCYFDTLKSKNLCRLYHIRLPNGQSISSQLVLLGSHPVSHSVCAGTDVEYMNSGVSAYLRWKVFQDLSKLGYIANDLTDASLNPVTRFKSQLGADLKLCIKLSKLGGLSSHFNRIIKDFKFCSKTIVASGIKKLGGKVKKKCDFSYWP